MSQGPASPEATSLEGSRRDDGASLSPPPPSDNSHGDKMAARRPTGEPPAQSRGRLPLHPENGRHPGAGFPAGLAVQMARTDSGPQVQEGRGPPARRALSRPDPQARAAGLLLRLCAPGSPPVGTRVPAEPGSWPPWGRGGPPAPRETWLLVLVRRRRGHQSPRSDLGEREVAEGGCVGGRGTLGREAPKNDLFSKNVYLKKQKTRKTTTKKASSSSPTPFVPLSRAFCPPLPHAQQVPPPPPPARPTPPGAPGPASGPRTRDEGAKREKSRPAQSARPSPSAHTRGSLKSRFDPLSVSLQVG